MRLGKGWIGAAVVAAGMLCGQYAFAAYYFNDFESASTTGFTGFAAQFLRNDTTGDPATATTLTLTGLPTHAGINLGFLLAIIDSWDSVGCWSPDFFTVKVDGVNVFNETFDNYHGGAGQSFGGAPIGGSRIQLGFNGGFNDAAYDLTSLGSLQNIAHTGSTLTIQFFASGPGWQGGSDESWAIDNLSIDLVGLTENAPEPRASC